VLSMMSFYSLHVKSRYLRENVLTETSHLNDSQKTKNPVSMYGVLFHSFIDFFFAVVIRPLRQDQYIVHPVDVRAKMAQFTVTTSRITDCTYLADESSSRAKSRY
jgi:hypothetical protein